jgi:hypothetical protein
MRGVEMNRLLLVLLVLLALVHATRVGRAQDGRAQAELAPLADTWNGIHTFIDISIGQNKSGNTLTQAQVKAIAWRFDFSMAGAGSYFATLRAGNPNFIYGNYIDSMQMESCHNPAGCPGGTDTNLSWLRATHPEWILYQCDRVTPLQSYDYIANIPDFTNPKYRDYRWTTEMLPRAGPGQVAIALDNAVLNNDFFPTPGKTYGHACGSYPTATPADPRPESAWVRKFAGVGAYADVTDPEFTNAAIDWYADVRNRLRKLSPPKLLIINSYPKMVYNYPTQRAALMNAVDGVMVQGSDYGPDLVGDPRKIWLGHIHFVEDMNGAGKAVYDEQVEPNTHDDSAIHPYYARFVLASYLLAKGRHAALIMTSTGNINFQSDDHHGLYWPADWDAAHNGRGVTGSIGMGTPCGPMQQVAGAPGVETPAMFFREYKGGAVLVNTSTIGPKEGFSGGSLSYNLPSGNWSWKDLSNTSVTEKRTLAPITSNAQGTAVRSADAGVYLKITTDGGPPTCSTKTQ